MIHIKRDNLRPHTKEEITWWMEQYSAGAIPDYQMSAWLMAVCWRGMTHDETSCLTRCMVESGRRLQWTVIDLVDKHSTGGVGDKISLVLAPLVASLGVMVPMMAGRGLGHTGGTIDKLEAIPGFQTTLSIPDFQSIVETVGCCIVSPSTELCLADRKLYALRDVTATVSSIPLQTSSILCKKIAEHPSSLVLDVKYGMGSFQETFDEAQELANSLIVTSEANGLVPTTCFLTRMDTLIGTSVGNWCEVLEAVELLKTGHGSEDLKTLVVIQATQMLHQTGTHRDEPWDDLLRMVLSKLESGEAYDVFKTMVQAQGGDVNVLDHPETYPHQAQYTQDLIATQTGYLEPFNGMLLGTLCVQLGAGRQVAEDSVDPMAGIVFRKQVGDYVQEGDLLATLSTNRANCLGIVTATLQEALQYSADPVHVPPIVSHIVTSKGTEEFTIPECLNYD